MGTDKGTLYLVSSPLGNLKDITLRAIEILGSVDLILSEDTRETDKILQHFQLKKSQIVYTDHKHALLYHKIKQFLEDGLNLALVSDSGTPLISDPGYKLVTNLVQEGFPVVSIPGPNAAIAALSISGLPTDKFTFLGFLPKKDNARKELLKTYGDLEATLIIYESPFRLKKLIEEVHETLGNRFVCIVKDITKYYEKVLRGELTAIIGRLSELPEKGEYVVLVAKKDYTEHGQPDL